jgi:predicted amidophosphoribosyltransferase
MHEFKGILSQDPSVVLCIKCHADFESIEKVVKKCAKKGYKQNKFDEHE